MSLAACVEKLPCPDCGSSDSLQSYLNKNEALGMEWYTSFCHGECWMQKGDPYDGTEGPKVHVKSESERRKEAEDILRCKRFVPKKNFRGIPPRQFLQWGLRVLLSEFDGKTPYAIGFPFSDYGDLSGWKARVIKTKDYFSIGAVTNVDLWGLVRAFRIGGDTLWITEGEYDAIALDYCLTLTGYQEKYPVVSLTHGGGSLGLNFEQVKDRIGKFKNIVLVLDDDKVGDNAVSTALVDWSDEFNIYFVSKPKGCKDANDAVINGQALLMGEMAHNFKELP